MDDLRQIIVCLLAASVLAACTPEAASQPAPQLTDPPDTIAAPAAERPPEDTNTPEPTATEAPPPVPDSAQVVPCAGEADLSEESIYPAPTGPYDVGITAFDLYDGTRSESYSEDPDDYRQVRIFVYYPAEAVDDASPCSFTGSFGLETSGFGVIAKLLNRGDRAGDLYETLSQTPLHAYPDADPVSGDERFPVVLYSNILSGMPTNQAAQEQELASHGYIVIDVEHSYGYLVELIGGFGLNRKQLDLTAHEQLAGEDMLFVLDQLESLDSGQPASILAGRFDLDHIGVAGYSSGGAGSARAADQDERVKAGISFDYEPATSNPLQQPYMFWAENQGLAYHNAEGPTYLIWMDGLGHGGFTDAILWPVGDTETTPDYLGSIDRLRGVQILNAYVLAFFDEHLRGIDQPLLDGPSGQYPEISLDSKNTD